MSRSKPIWNKVTSCRYSKPPSWGGFNDVSMRTFSGSSSSNSHFLAEIKISRKFYDNFVVFNYYFDGKLMKQNIHLVNGDRAGEWLETRKRNFLNSSNQYVHAVNRKYKSKIK